MIITSLFLSGKVEECPRKLRDVILVCFGVCNPNSALQETDKTFLYLKNEVLTHEILLLKTVGFDFNIDHPHKYILRYSFRDFPPNFNESKFRQTAWNFANDSLYATLCLRYSAPIIAAAVMELAAKYMKLEFPPGRTPGEFFHARKEDLKQIRNEIIDHYQMRPGHDSHKIHLPVADQSSPVSQNPSASTGNLEKSMENTNSPIESTTVSSLDVNEPGSSQPLDSSQSSSNSPSSQKEVCLSSSTKKAETTPTLQQQQQQLPATSSSKRSSPFSHSSDERPSKKMRSVPEPGEISEATVV